MSSSIPPLTVAQWAETQSSGPLRDGTYICAVCGADSYPYPQYLRFVSHWAGVDSVFPVTPDIHRRLCFECAERYLAAQEEHYRGESTPAVSSAVSPATPPKSPWANPSPPQEPTPVTSPATSPAVSSAVSPVTSPQERNSHTPMIPPRVTPIIPPAYNEPPIQYLLQNERTLAKEAAQKLSEAFTWEDSAEGGEFWQSVYTRLNALATGEALA